MSTTKENVEQSEASACSSWDRNNPDQQEVSRILKGFRLDVMGVISLGTDGVLRSLTADRRVLNAEGLSPKLIETFLHRVPSDYRTGFEEADGTKTPREKWFKPDDGILPAPLAEDHIEKNRNMSEEQKEKLRENMKKDPNLIDVSGVVGPPTPI